MPTYQERERELATAVLADPTCTPEDRAAARSRLRSGSASGPYDVERLSDIEIDMCIYLHERARGAVPSFVPRCERCSGFPDEELQHLRELIDEESKDNAE